MTDEIQQPSSTSPQHLEELAKEFDRRAEVNQKTLEQVGGKEHAGRKDAYEQAASLLRELGSSTSPQQEVEATDDNSSGVEDKAAEAERYAEAKEKRREFGFAGEHRAYAKGLREGAALARAEGAEPMASMADIGRALQAQILRLAAETPCPDFDEAREHCDCLLCRTQMIVAQWEDDPRFDSALTQPPADPEVGEKLKAGLVLRHPAGSEWKLIEHVGGEEDDWRVECVTSLGGPLLGRVGERRVFHREYIDRTFDLSHLPEADPEVPRCGRESDYERVARAFHGIYEATAPDHGYETRPESRVAWEEVPEKNRALMIGTVRRLVETGVITIPGRPSDYLQAGLQWAVDWIDGCKEIPVKEDEPDDWRQYWAAKELLLELHGSDCQSTPELLGEEKRCGGKCEGFKSLDFLARALIDARSTQPVSESPGNSGVEIEGAMLTQQDGRELARLEARAERAVAIALASTGDEGMVLVRANSPEIRRQAREILDSVQPAASTQPPSPQAGLDRIEDELNPLCARCHQPRSRHVPGPPTPPKVAGHLGATEDAPGCCNDFQPAPALKAAPVIEQPHDFSSPQAEAQDCEEVDGQIEALAKARRERNRGDTLPWDELPEIAKGPIRKAAAEDLRNGTGKQPPAEPQGDVVEKLAEALGWDLEEPDAEPGEVRRNVEKILAEIKPLLALDVRERLEELVNAVAAAWPVICDGTPAEVAPVREALRNARAALTPAPSEPGEGK